MNQIDPKNELVPYVPETPMKRLWRRSKPLLLGLLTMAVAAVAVWRSGNWVTKTSPPPRVLAVAESMADTNVELAGAEEFFPAFELQPLPENTPFEPTPEFSDLDTGALRKIEQEMKQSISLARRGGYFAARSRLIGCLRQVARLRDAQNDVDTHSTALATALLALDEADDFDEQGSQCESDTLTANFIAGHRTPVLKGAPTASAVRARRAYYLFAREKLVEAAGGQKVSADLLYALGRVERELTLADSKDSRRRGPREIPLFEAAVAVNPRHHVAANELGVSLARNGDLRRSRIALAHSAKILSTPEVLINLDYVCQQLGDHATAGKVRQQMAVAHHVVRKGPEVRVVSVGEFQGIPMPAVENIQTQTMAGNRPGKTVAAGANLPRQVRPPTPTDRDAEHSAQRPAHEFFW